MRFLKRHWPGLLTLTLILGWIAWVPVPVVRLAMQRSKQKRTMVGMRDIASAWEARATDLNTYGIGRITPRNPKVMYRVKPADLKRAVAPKYIRQFPVKDGWGRDFELWVSGDSQTYAIRSRGRDGHLDSPLIASVGPTTNLDNDIVYSNGAFIEYPEGAG